MSIFDTKDSKSGESLDGYLGRAAQVEGTIRFQNMLRIDGKVVGKIISENDLVVGESAVVEADVEVARMSVAGKVTGKIKIADRLEIHPGGRVAGELTMAAPRLVIEEGAVLEGKVEMGGEPAAKNIRKVEPLPETGQIRGLQASGDGGS
jgi:cytoskeletal protein CcmA (bactofilin family)